MPRRDKTGPEGEGPMTGGKRGDCAEDSKSKKSSKKRPKDGRGRGFGFGNGMGPRFGKEGEGDAN